jgi:hypothetical protein
LKSKKSIDLARSHIVSLVSGGDAGIYGMASIVLEVLEHQGIDISMEIIPGITAAQATASRLGSPLSGDFVVISLSDLLTRTPVVTDGAWGTQLQQRGLQPGECPDAWNLSHPIVVKDIEKTAEYYTSTFGIGPFSIIASIWRA